MSTVRNDYDTPDGTGVRVAVPNCPEWREDGTVAVLLASEEQGTGYPYHQEDTGQSRLYFEDCHRLFSLGAREGKQEEWRV